MSFPLLVIAALGAIAIVVGKLAKRAIPEIVVFLGLGVLIGPQGPFGLINDDNIRSLVLLTQVALAAVIFLIGDRLRFDDLKERRRLLVPLNLAQVALSSALVLAVMTVIGVDTRTAVVLALIAAETGVLTITATVSEERAQGDYTEVLLTSVGLTNVAVAALFGLAFPFVLAATAGGDSLLVSAQVFLRLVILSALVGVAGGWLLRTFARNFETSGELLLFLLIVLIGLTGAARAGRGSVVVSALIAGLYVANTAPWLADRLFAAVRALEAPIYLAFFTVAGAGIHLDELASVGGLAAAYVAARGLGKVGGSL
ncbi:MAG: cation:proton antiporter, partial [Actinomycetota bacterium]|nr:cation:proton antiporter [Actinomycetota bacterium]